MDLPEVDQQHLPLVNDDAKGALGNFGPDLQHPEPKLADVVAQLVTPERINVACAVCGLGDARGVIHVHRIGSRLSYDRSGDATRSLGLRQPRG